MSKSAKLLVFAIICIVLLKLNTISMNTSAEQRIKQIKKEVKQIFIDYLEKNNQRRTVERYAILEEIYSIKSHFDADELYLRMNNKKYRVSRATVYNTLELLVDSGLVKKHQFGKNTSLFEQAYGYKQHDHMICTKCEKVLEFCDPRIQQISSTMGGLLNMNVVSHSLHLFAEPLADADGNCKQCGMMVPVLPTENN